ncbi:aldolase [Aestuariibacter sp. GS-14]|uniref:aldolase catalytic domain-containing protein n=1 Tax=Aestuariibacter sp. GS-14 TaxID=2590670 RepID=UPI00112BE28B|nr:aldolase catalytic domain-containing protein [Aestuariibacter sp. GS-14]TPV55124.1 aldolase [Aestuariibacter sp. GS-14]
MYILDCTLRDGGYYNGWNFPTETVGKYLTAMSAAKVDIVELGLRSLKNSGFKGASAYTTDEYITSLNVPESLDVAVMVNASELIGDFPIAEVLSKLFPNDSSLSPVKIVRIACHVHEFEAALPSTTWLKEKGFKVGFNLMQVADRAQHEVENLAKAASAFDIDALYFADSMGSMDPAQCKKIISWLRKYWDGALGIHTHDNMGKALQNTLTAIEAGVTWLDSTVTGMGRGPGNARTEELAIEISSLRGESVNLVPLLSLIKNYFQPLKNECGWGSNPYYYLSGKYGIHPTFVQEMLSDPRFDEEDILATLEHLRIEGGAKFSYDTLDATRNFYANPPKGSWEPSSVLSGKDVLILGAGRGLSEHSFAVQKYIDKYKPIVIAMNTQSVLPEEKIDLRIASHPVRLLADCDKHAKLPQPLIVPLEALPADVLKSLGNKHCLNFGLQVRGNEFVVNPVNAILPNSLVISYALAVAASGNCNQIYLAGFDGFGASDNRTQEMQKIFNLFTDKTGISLISITNTTYDIPSISVYGL